MKFKSQQENCYTTTFLTDLFEKTSPLLTLHMLHAALLFTLSFTSWNESVIPLLLVSSIAHLSSWWSWEKIAGTKWAEERKNKMKYNTNPERIYTILVNTPCSCYSLCLLIPAEDFTSGTNQLSCEREWNSITDARQDRNVFNVISHEKISEWIVVPDKKCFTFGQNLIFSASEKTSRKRMVIMITNRRRKGMKRYLPSA